MQIESFRSEFLEIFEDDSLALWHVELCYTKRFVEILTPRTLECGLVGKMALYRYT